MTRAPCCEKVGLRRGRWTAEEDAILINYIHQFGEGSWKSLPMKAGLLRCGKSCRLRWINYLRSDLKRGNFSIDEEETIIQLHRSLGNRWSMIASHLPGRTDNEIKNYWNSHLSRKLYGFTTNKSNTDNNSTLKTTVIDLIKVSNNTTSSKRQGGGGCGRGRRSIANKYNKSNTSQYSRNKSISNLKVDELQDDFKDTEKKIDSDRELKNLRQENTYDGEDIWECIDNAINVLEKVEPFENENEECCFLTRTLLDQMQDLSPLILRNEGMFQDFYMEMNDENLYHKVFSPFQLKNEDLTNNDWDFNVGAFSNDGLWDYQDNDNLHLGLNHVSLSL